MPTQFSDFIVFSIQRYLPLIQCSVDRDIIWSVLQLLFPSNSTIRDAFHIDPSRVIKAQMRITKLENAIDEINTTSVVDAAKTVECRIERLESQKRALPELMMNVDTFPRDQQCVFQLRLSKLAFQLNELLISRDIVEHTTALRVAAKKLEIVKYALIGHSSGRSIKCDPEMQLYAITALNTNDGIAEARRKNSAVQISKQRVTQEMLQLKANEFVALRVYHSNPKMTAAEAINLRPLTPNLDITNHIKNSISSAKHFSSLGQPARKNSTSAKRQPKNARFLWKFEIPAKNNLRSGINTHCERGNVKHIQIRIYTDDDKESWFTTSEDDHAYVRPFSSEGNSNSRNKRMLHSTVGTSDATYSLHDSTTNTISFIGFDTHNFNPPWSHLIPSVFLILDKKQVGFTDSISGDSRRLQTTPDSQPVVIVHPKFDRPSTPSEWVEMRFMLKNLYPDKSLHGYTSDYPFSENIYALLYIRDFLSKL